MEKDANHPVTIAFTPARTVVLSNIRASTIKVRVTEGSQ